MVTSHSHNPPNNPTRKNAGRGSISPRGLFARMRGARAPKSKAPDNVARQAEEIRRKTTRAHRFGIVALTAAGGAGVLAAGFLIQDRELGRKVAHVISALTVTASTALTARSYRRQANHPLLKKITNTLQRKAATDAEFRKSIQPYEYVIINTIGEMWGSNRFVWNLIQDHVIIPCKTILSNR